MLAGNIIKYFQDDVLATCMGKRARERALKNHDRKKIMRIDVYIQRNCRY